MKKFFAIVQVILIMIIVVFSGVETVLAAPTFVNSMDFNGHHYEVYFENGISWTNAKAYAENKEYNGQQGYLATVTTMAEHNAVAELNPSSADSYLGAIGSVPNNASTWKWATGPEAGQPVMTSRPPWMSGEPNNTYPNEVYLIIRANNLWDNRAVTNKWVSYFIVEYGGLGAASEPSGEKDITSFSVDYQLYSTEITENAVTVTITNPSSLSSIRPRIVVSNKATISPASDTAQNFNNAVHYTVTAEDGSTKEYIVTVLARYTVSFDANGGTGAPSYITGAAGSTITIPSAEPTNGGMIFSGWNTEADGTGDTYWPNGSMAVPVNGDMLFAQWNEPSYSITYHNVEGTSNSNPSSYTASDTPLTLHDLGARTGYSFGGWYDNAELSGGAVTAIPVGNTGAKTFWAKWTQNEYTVSYSGNDSDGGTIPSDTKVYHYEDRVTVLSGEPTKTGYTFHSWSDGTNTYQSGEKFDMPADDVTLTAQWTAVDYAVSYDGNGNDGGTVPEDTKTYYCEAEVTVLPEKPTKTGYTFGGWSDGTNTYKEGDKFVMPANNVKLTAQWTAIDYTVRYDGNENDGGVVPADAAYHYKDRVKISASEPTKTGYTFGGWSDGTKTYEAGGTFVMPANNVKLMAQWTVNSYTISLEENGGSAVSDITRPFGSVISQADLNNPTLKNYTFGGWHADKEFKNTVMFPYTVTGNTAWYAGWDEIPVTSITLNNTSSALYTGGTVQLTAAVQPGDATNPAVTWTSSNPDVVAVDSNGKVTAAAAGTVTITATADGVSATCTIKVIKKAAPKAAPSAAATAQTEEDTEKETGAAPTPSPTLAPKPSSTADEQAGGAVTLIPLSVQENAENDSYIIEISIDDLPEGTKKIQLPDGQVIDLDGAAIAQIMIAQDELNADGTLKIIALDDEGTPLMNFDVKVGHDAFGFSDVEDFGVSVLSVVIWILGGILLAGMVLLVIMASRKKQDDHR